MISFGATDFRKMFGGGPFLLPKGGKRGGGTFEMLIAPLARGEARRFGVGPVDGKERLGSRNTEGPLRL